MSIMQPRIYLASQSPRRRELLKQIGIRFELLLLRTDSRRHADVDEAPYPGEAPEVYVQRLSRGKAQVGFDALQLRHLPPHPVLAADTTVTLDGKIFGKPQHADQAATMLRELSGREHQVLTAVAIAMGSHIEVLLSSSTVRFTKLSEARIHRYLQTHEYADKAGGYAIQGQAGAFIEHINGSYSGVMGLPLFETAQLLQRFNYPTP
jgi:septum formation protein